MVSLCTVPARGVRSCERFGGYKTINRIRLPLPLYNEYQHDRVQMAFLNLCILVLGTKLALALKGLMINQKSW